MRRWLQLSIDQFRQHQENLIGRIPKHVRNMTLRELRDKYNGDMQAATIGGPMERLQEVGGREREELNKKRKWVEEDNEARKNARLHSPVKKPPPSNVRRTPVRGSPIQWLSMVNAYLLRADAPRHPAQATIRPRTQPFTLETVVV